MRTDSMNEKLIDARSPLPTNESTGIKYSIRPIFRDSTCPLFFEPFLSFPFLSFPIFLFPNTSSFFYISNSTTTRSTTQPKKTAFSCSLGQPSTTTGQPANRPTRHPTQCALRCGPAELIRTTLFGKVRQPILFTSSRSSPTLLPSFLNFSQTCLLCPLLNAFSRQLCPSYTRSRN
ncbi:hypothetical protein B0H65DRAFT_158577 [Neurospora tetraspora]|uniref:Uncharacterized protein n=1 Tax=Neurospora tetraspora TaxID=94610 RepID=A0AAE0JI55_9PEZI|nr:hypothetical protein B0H65DRAFT_158577 [Neurospora tetraspora]